MNKISFSAIKENKVNELKALYEKAKQIALEFWKKQKEDFVKLKEIKKDFCGNNYQLGLFHLFSHNYADAILRFTFVTIVRKDYYQAYIRLAQCWHQKNKPGQAAKNLTKVAALKPKDPIYQYVKEVVSGKLPKVIPQEFLLEFYKNLPAKEQEKLVDAKRTSTEDMVQMLHTSSLKEKDTALVLDACEHYLANSIKNKFPALGVNLMPSKYLSLAKKEKDNTINALLTTLPYTELKGIKAKYNLVVANLPLTTNSNVEEYLSELCNLIAKKGYLLGCFTLIEDQKKASLDEDLVNYNYSFEQLKEAIKKNKLELVSEKKLPSDNQKTFNYVFLCKN